MLSSSSSWLCGPVSWIFWISGSQTPFFVSSAMMGNLRKRMIVLSARGCPVRSFVCGCARRHQMIWTPSRNGAETTIQWGWDRVCLQVNCLRRHRVLRWTPIAYEFGVERRTPWKERYRLCLTKIDERRQEFARNALFLIWTVSARCSLYLYNISGSSFWNVRNSARSRCGKVWVLEKCVGETHSNFTRMSYRSCLPLSLKNTYFSKKDYK